jgi:hypothetical protein
MRREGWPEQFLGWELPVGRRRGDRGILFPVPAVSVIIDPSGPLKKLEWVVVVLTPRDVGGWHLDCTGDSR